MKKEIVGALVIGGVIWWIYQSQKKKDPTGYVRTKSGKLVKASIEVKPLENISQKQYEKGSLLSAIEKIFGSKKAATLKNVSQSIVKNPFLR